MIEPIRPEQDALELMDQRALPEEVRFLHCTRGNEVIEAIQTLAVRGAPAIGIAGAYGLWLEARALRDASDFQSRVKEAKDAIRNARPTAVNLAWAIDRIWRQVEGMAASEMVPRLREMADQLFHEEWARNDRMASYGADLLLPGSRVLTHCNTGSLATVGVGTALGVIREGHRRGLVREVLADETRPLLQGARLTAWELQQDQIPVAVITDSMAASLMAAGRVDAVLVGADRICANGDTANKIGTYSLAVLAQYHHVPFYVAAPMSTIDPELADGSQIPIEQRNPDEVRQVRGAIIAPRDVAVYNPAFDVTPGALITAIITDRGVARWPYGRDIPRLIKTEAEGGQHHE